MHGHAESLTTIFLQLRKGSILHRFYTMRLAIHWYNGMPTSRLKGNVMPSDSPM